jgi:hypothetical protein
MVPADRDGYGDGGVDSPCESVGVGARTYISQFRQQFPWLAEGKTDRQILSDGEADCADVAAAVELTTPAMRSVTARATRQPTSSRSPTSPSWQRSPSAASAEARPDDITDITAALTQRTEDRTTVLKITQTY